MLKDQSSSSANRRCYSINELGRAINEAMDTSPVRRPNSHVHGTKTIVVPSRSDAEGLEFEGAPEGALRVHLEFLPGFRRCKPQPFEIRLFDGLRVRRYTPDLLIFTEGPPILAEVKPAYHFFRPEVKRLVAAMTKACSLEGIEFRTYGAEQLQQQPRLDNLQLLLPFTRDANYALPNLLRILKKAGRPMPLASLQKLDASIDASTIAVGLRRGQLGSSHRFSYGPQFNVYAR